MDINGQIQYLSTDLCGVLMAFSLVRPAGTLRASPNMRIGPEAGRPPNSIHQENAEAIAKLID